MKSKILWALVAVLAIATGYVLAKRGTPEYRECVKVARSMNVAPTHCEVLR